jgi:addiction module HigA family antidote
MKIMHNPPHPGEVLKELYLDPLNLTVTEAAKGLKVTRKTLSAIINGRAGISSDMSIRFARAFNTTPESWLNLQLQYNLWHSQQEIDVSDIKVFSDVKSQRKP